MPGAPLPDLDLYYDVHGAGPPLVLIAGLGSDSQSWMPVRAALGARFRLIAPDNRGTGRTRPADAPLSVARIADDLAGLLDHLGLERAHVLGHSFGGLVAREFAVRHPARVERLVLAASGDLSPRTAGLLRDLAAARLAGLAPELWFRLLFQWLFRPALLAQPARLADLARIAAAYPYLQSAAAFSAQLEAGLVPGLATSAAIRAPTLVLCGALDALLSPAESRASLEAIPDHAFAVLDGAAHSLHWDEPAAFAQAVGAFLRPDSR